MVNRNLSKKEMTFIYNLRQFHNYVFYRFHKSIIGSDFGFLAEWRAVMLLIIMEIILTFCLIIPINLVLGIELLSKTFIIVLVMFLVVKNYFMYDYNDKWKEIIKIYDSPGRKTKKAYSIGYWVIILGLFPLLIIEFYILGKIKGTI